MEGKKILIVDDEAAIRDMLRFALAKEAFTVVEAVDAKTARAQVADEQPDLVLLDWMMPEVSGIEVARWLRREEDYRHIPIIMLTARGEEDDRVRGLETGADDYLTKPFSTRELVARIRAVLRRVTPGDEGLLEFGHLVLDGVSARVTANDETVHLGPTEFRLLKFFMEHPDRVYSRTQLLDRVWGTNVYVEERTVDVHIRRLRKALESANCDDYIQTVRGMGYRFSVQ